MSKKKSVQKKVKKAIVKVKQKPEPEVIYKDRIVTEVKHLKPEWVNVKFKLPPFNHPVLLMQEDAAIADMVIVGHRVSQDVDGNHYTIDKDKVSTVSYWMEIPDFGVMRKIITQ